MPPPWSVTSTVTSMVACSDSMMLLTGLNPRISALGEVIFISGGSLKLAMLTSEPVISSPARMRAPRLGV